MNNIMLQSEVSDLKPDCQDTFLIVVILHCEYHTVGQISD